MVRNKHNIPGNVRQYRKSQKREIRKKTAVPMPGRRRGRGLLPTDEADWYASAWLI